MKTKLLISIFTFLVCVKMCQSQEWMHIIEGNEYILTRNVHEFYDKGYLITGQQWTGNTYYGWILKTDINGNELWSKFFGKPDKMNGFSCTELTSDHGLVCVGSTNFIVHSKHDPLIVKLNQCGEKEWCRIFNSSDWGSFSTDIVTVGSDNEGYVILVENWVAGPDLWIFRLDSLGDVIWTQQIAADPDTFWSPAASDLLSMSDSSIIVTGRAYTPDSLTPGSSIIKMFNAKVNLNGDILFELPWGMNTGMITEGHQTIEDNHHNLFHAGRLYGTSPPTPEKPTLMKTSSDGYPVGFSGLRSPGLATTINWLQDSTLVLGADFQDSDWHDTLVVTKLDTAGNILKTKPLIVNEAILFYGSDVTDDNKILFVGNTILGWHYTYLFKLTSDLEYDSIYTTPFTYDSLCPHPIVSDTIPLDDCEVVVVGIDDPVQHPEKTKLKVYPNPAGSMVTVEMPEYLVRSQESGGQGDEGRGTKDEGRKEHMGITATTYYHQWKSVRLDVFDLFGKLMYSQEIPGKKDKVELNISSWPAGMYVARIVFMNDVVGAVKFVKE